MKSGRAALISTFIVGGGQIYSGRLWVGIAIAIIFYGSIAIMINIWSGFNQAFWGLSAAWTMLWLYNILDAYRGFRYQKPPCEKTCPAGMAPWVYINHMATGKDEPYPYVPFFDTLGKICLAPCENHCTRRGIDASVAIRYLKAGVKTQLPDHTHKPRKQKVAIIGAGPCGLSAAYYLRHRGYNVTVYEKEDRPGGVLGLLIPEFRHPQATLDQEIGIILKMGFELKCGVEVGRNVTMDELLSNYDAIFLAAGLWKPVKLGIPGEENALDGFDVLRRIRNGESFHLGKIGVIGGGNTAIDIARSLVREGNEVKIYYRRRLQDMPAEQENLAEALEEGIEIVELVMAVKIESHKVTMLRTECTEGRKSVLRQIPRSEFEVSLDNVVMAIGQQPDVNFLNGLVKFDKHGRVMTKKSQTSHPRIFAGGDVVLGSATIAHAVGHGMEAARRIDAHLRHLPYSVAALLRKTCKPRVQSLPVKKMERIRIPHRDVAERKQDFREVELCASKEEFKEEATRCLTCPLRYHPR